MESYCFDNRKSLQPKVYMTAIAQTLISTPGYPESTTIRPVQSHQGLYAASILDINQESLQLAPGGYLSSMLIQKATEHIWDASLSVSEIKVRSRRSIKASPVALINEFDHDSGRYAHLRFSIMEEHRNCASFEVSFLKGVESNPLVDPEFTTAPQPYRLTAWKRSDGEVFNRHFYYRKLDTLMDPKETNGGGITARARLPDRCLS